MPIITYKLLSGITATIIPGQQFIVTSAFPAPSTTLDLSAGNYILLFGNVDGVLSKDPSVPATATFGTFYYALAGSGTGPGGGDPSVMAVGFDAVADELVPVTFTAAQGDGLITKSLPPIASGTFTDTLNFAFTLTPPTSDGVAQTSAYDPAVFSYWLNVYTGAEQFEIAWKGFEIGESLKLAPNASGIYLAVYVAKLKPVATQPVVGGTVKLPADCPALLANAAAAAQMYGFGAGR